MTKIAVEDADDPPPYSPNHALPVKESYMVKKRSCTDVFCLILLIIFTIAQIALIIFACITGNPARATGLIDSQGNECKIGQKLLIFEMISCSKLGPAVVFSGCPSSTTCVDNCPTKNWSWKLLHDKETTTGSKILNRRKDELICMKNVDKFEKSVKELIESEQCAPYYLESKPILHFCLPLILKDAKDSVKDSNGNVMYDKDGKTIDWSSLAVAVSNNITFLKVHEWFNEVVSFLSKDWVIISALVLGGGLLALFWCLLLRYFTTVIVYMTISIFVVVFVGTTIFCYIQYHFVATDSAPGQFVISTNINTYLNLKEFWLALAIIGTIISLILLITVIFLRKRIKLAVQIISHAARAIGRMLSTLFFPIIPLIAEALVITVWFILTWLISSIGKEEYVKFSNTFQSSPCTKEETQIVSHRCYFSGFKVHAWTYGLHAYNLFFSFWLLTFFHGLNVLILAGAFASWYWTFDKSDLPLFPLLKSIKNAFYHLGTVAFGSLLIAIVMFLRAVLSFIQDRVGGAGDANACAQFVFCCCQCCLWCLEKVLRFLTKNAFIMTAIKGYSFCKAAKEGFFLITRNCLRLFVVDRITTFVLFLGKLTIMVGLGVSSYYIFKDRTEFIYVPIIIVVLGSYIITSFFFSVFEISVDTIFLCVMDDLEHNDGSEQKPYYMSRELMKALTKKNVIAKPTEPPTNQEAV